MTHEQDGLTVKWNEEKFAEKQSRRTNTISTAVKKKWDTVMKQQDAIEDSKRQRLERWIGAKQCGARGEMRPQAGWRPRAWRQRFYTLVRRRRATCLYGADVTLNSSPQEASILIIVPFSQRSQPSVPNPPGKKTSFHTETQPCIPEYDTDRLTETHRYSAGRFPFLL